MNKDSYFALFNNLSEPEIAEIDDLLIGHVTLHWRTLSFIVGSSMSISGNPHKLIDTFFGERLVELVKQHGLEYTGTLGSFRNCEIRRSAQSDL